MPLISVIMSVHRYEFLKEAMDSILAQTFKDFECIIVNDEGGQEGIVQFILDKYKDPRIKIIKNQNQLGLTESLNICMAEAQGELFARHDGDDIALPHRFEKQIPYFQEDVGVVSCWGKNVNEHGADHPLYWVDTITHIPEDIIPRFLTHTNCILSPGAIFSRTVYDKIGDFDPKMKVAQDYNYWLRAIQHFKIRVVPEVLVLKRWHQYNIWNSPISETKDWMTLAKKRANTHPKHPIIYKNCL